MAEKSLYERLGGIYSISAVSAHFVKALADDPLIGEKSDNEFLRDWYANRRWCEPGFIVLQAIWIADKAGGPYDYVSTIPNDGGLDLEPTHFIMKLIEAEFNAAGEVLANSLDHFDVPEKEKNEVLDAFVAHKEEVISGTIK